MIKIAIVLLFTYTLNAQESITLSVAQDVKMAFKGVSKIDSDPALNMLFQVRLEARQDKLGFFSLVLGHEYAELTPVYKRNSVDIGYTFNRLFIDNIELGAYVGLGNINRFSENLPSFGFGGDINYVIGDLKLGFFLQCVQRSDLGFRYDKKSPYIFSGFLKVTYVLFRPRSRK